MEIPFPFRAGHSVLEAGTYRVAAMHSQASFEISDLRTGRTVLVVPNIAKDPDKEWENSAGVLLFACQNQCALHEIWTNTGHPARVIPRGKSASGKPIRLAAIRMSLSE